MGFLAGLFTGVSQGLGDYIARRNQEDVRQVQLEQTILTHLAQTSDDPEVRAMALAGMLELSQGRKRGGFLGLGKLRGTPAFEQLMKVGRAASQLDQREDLDVARRAFQPPPSAPEAGGTTGGAAAGALRLPTAFGMGAVQAAGAGARTGALEAPPAAPGAPLAALPATTPVTGGPAVPAPIAAPAPGLAGPSAPIAPTAPASATSSFAAAPPPGAPGTLPETVSKPDVFGTIGPLGRAAQQEVIRGQVTAEQQRQYEARLEQERLRQEGARSREAAREAEAERRHVERMTGFETSVQTRLAGIEAANARFFAGQGGRDELAFDRAREDLIKARDAALLELDRDAARQLGDPRRMDTSSPEGMRRYLEFKGRIWETFTNQLRVLSEGRGRSDVSGAKGAGAVAPTAMPPPSSAPSGPGATGGSAPPGAPPDYSQVPNWPAVRARIDQARRQGATPQQLAEAARAAGAPPDVLAAIQRYLGLVR